MGTPDRVHKSLPCLLDKRKAVRPLVDRVGQHPRASDDLLLPPEAFECAFEVSEMPVGDAEIAGGVRRVDPQQALEDAR